MPEPDFAHVLGLIEIVRGVACLGSIEAVGDCPADEDEGTGSEDAASADLVSWVVVSGIHGSCTHSTTTCSLTMTMTLFVVATV